MQKDVTKNTPGKYDMFGDLTTQKWAYDALPVLIGQAKTSEIIRYEELRDAISATTNRKMGFVCDIISTTLYRLEHNELQKHWQRGHIPRLTNIVIRTNGNPGEWMCLQITGDRKVVPSWEEYESKYVQPIFDYLHWDEVHEALASERIDKALAELDIAKDTYYRISDKRSNAKTHLEQYQLQKPLADKLKKLSNAEEAWQEAIESYAQWFHS